MKKILLVVGLLIIGYIIGYYSHSPTQVIYKTIEVDKKIRDSLNIVNDTITNKIEHITKKYYDRNKSALHPCFMVGVEYVLKHLNTITTENN